LKAALAEAQKAFADGQDALKKGDFAAYGEAQKRLQAAIADAVAAQSSGSFDGPGAQWHQDHGTCAQCDCQAVIAGNRVGSGGFGVSVRFAWGCVYRRGGGGAGTAMTSGEHRARPEIAQVRGDSGHVTRCGAERCHHRGPVEDLGAGCGWIDRVFSDPSELDSPIPVVNALLIQTRRSLRGPWMLRAELKAMPASPMTTPMA